MSAKRKMKNVGERGKSGLSVRVGDANGLSYTGHDWRRNMTATANNKSQTWPLIWFGNVSRMEITKVNIEGLRPLRARGQAMEKLGEASAMKGNCSKREENKG